MHSFNYFLRPINPEEAPIFLSDKNKEGMTKLGKKLENPYTVDNMKRALENLKLSNTRTKSEEELEISTTHNYIRFKPKNEEELSDSTLILYSYPLDYEIEEQGDFYHDPEIPIDQPTYQYCAVEVDKVLPESVAYELLVELFIPDEESDEYSEESEGARIASSRFVEALVDESLKLTGNLEDKDTDYSSARRSRWRPRPAGRVRVWDDRARRYVLAVDVEVRVRRWFTTHNGVGKLFL